MKHHSEAQFDAVVRDNMPSLMAYARSITRNHSVAEEAVQETFIRAWKYWPSFRHESPVLSWLITICRRVVIDIARNTKHTEQLMDNVVHYDHNFSNFAVEEMVKELPLPQREVIVLCAILGFDYKTAAQTLNIPVGTVRSRLARAREQLSSQLAQALAI